MIRRIVVCLPSPSYWRTLWTPWVSVMLPAWRGQEGMSLGHRP